jgi:DeoR/GlpR family transcriptional regulator of sugar metabolism
MRSKAGKTSLSTDISINSDKLIISINMESLLKEERQQQILEALQENNRVTVPELSARFGTSDVTIRRDLTELAAGGKLIRAHRGALKVTPAPPEAPVVQRMAQDHELKESIAAAAVELVQDGDSIFIGSGSTMAVFARRLAGKKRLTVFTNALNIAADLAGGPDELTVVVTGGVVRAAELSLLGHIAELTLPEVRVNKVFMGAQALSIESGWTTDAMAEVQTTRRIFEMSAELIVLADHTKLGHTAAAYIAPLQRITTLVTDAGAEAGFLAQAHAQGLRVIVV